jgi:uncharacterized membrane protein
MTEFLLGLLIFLGAHSFRLLAPDLRLKCQGWLGLNAYRVIYGVVSLAGLWLTVRGFGLARATEAQLWVAPFWVRHLTVALMWPASIMLVSAFVPGNGIRSRLRHPMTLSIKIWALAHLLANGHLAHLLLFGSILVWSVLIYKSAKQEDRSRMVGLMSNRTHLINLGTLVSVLGGSALWFWFAMGGAHLALIGVSPLG